MISLSLLLSMVALSLLASPHCATMCACGLARPWMALPALRQRFFIGRGVAYSAAGALVGGASMGLAQLAWQRLPMLQALHWMLMAALALSATVLLVWGRPLVGASNETAIRLSPVLSRRLGAEQPTPSSAWTAGVLWPLLPCGVLWSALALAYLGGSALQGAVLMAVFALLTGVGMHTMARVRQHLAGRLPERTLNRASGGLILLGLAVMVGRLLDWLPTPPALQVLGICW
ncbi:MAG TPA: sulfite exporter TauE/SafE family protein [Limnobacter sp.]|uniref:sulfite exporter TauE/SafE family protein n=1 Tax=Limnobacter sp. TaxID=2003368 RepID=UPI002ED7A313